MDVKTRCTEIRKAIKEVAELTRRFKGELPLVDLSAAAVPQADRGEMIANATLAYRHLEDAAMRFGKVLQAYDGGVSVYDK